MPRQTVRFPSARSRAAAPAPAAAGHRPLVLAVALAAGFGALPARAQPTGANAIHGTAHVQQNGTTTVVTTTNGAGSNHSAINWQSFNIPGGTTTHFAQPNATSTSINRVVGSDPSAIFGTLSSNGRLVLVNPHGIAVGAGAVVDTAGFTASTLRMSDADAIAGRLRFGDGSGATLRVDGTVLARQGDVVLIGQRVETGSQALVEAPNGATVLAAGQKVEVTGRGLEGIFFEVQAPSDQAVNLGTLRGDAVGIFAGTLRHSGLVQAQAVTTEGGKVVLKAADQALVAGRVEARGLAGQGGSVDVLGDKVGLLAGAVVDTSNVNGGGQIRIGGDYQGKNAAVQNASVTYVDKDAVVRANATQNGDGGRVIVWADDTTRMFGRIEANAGAQGGNGGFIETSGKRFLDIAGAQVQALAPKGTAGTWLLDPSEIHIVASVPPAPSPPQDLGGGPNFDSAADSDVSLLTVAALNAALNSFGSVQIQTDGGAGTGSGDIVFSAAGGPDLNIAYTGGATGTLTLKAQNQIRFEAGTNTSFQANGPAGSRLDVVMQTGLDGGTGGIESDAGSTVRFSTNNNANAVTATVTGGKTWSNFGNVVLNLNARLQLNDGTDDAAFENYGSLTGATGAGGGVFGGSVMNGGSLDLTQGKFEVASLYSYGDFRFDGQKFQSASTDVNGGSFDVRTTSGDIAINGSTAQTDGAFRLRAEGGNVSVSQSIEAAEVELRAAGTVDFWYIDTAGNGMSRTNGGNVTIVAGSHVTGQSIDAYGYQSNSSLGPGGGGQVLISSGGDVSIDSGIWTRGGDSTTSAGAPAGHGGGVSITAAGTVATMEIDSGGGDGWGSFGSAGGNGGNIFIQAGGGLTLYSGEGYGRIDSSGGQGGSSYTGNGGAGGHAGSVTIVAGGNSALDGHIYATGGDGGYSYASGTGGSGGSGAPVSIAMSEGASMYLRGVHAGGGVGGEGPGGNGAQGAGSTFTTSGGTLNVPSSWEVPSTDPSGGWIESSMDVDAQWINSSRVVLDTDAWVRVTGGMVNEGTIDLGAGSLLSLGTYSEADDMFTPGGVTLLNGSSGVIQGHGTVQATVSNAGTIRPGGAGGIGRLTVMGDLYQQATGRLEFDVMAGSPYIPAETYDQLRVQGTLGLGGQVLVTTTTAAATPAPTPTFTPTPTGTLSLFAMSLAAASTSSEPTSTYELIHTDAIAGSEFSLISGPPDILALARMRVGDSLMNLPGGTASQLIAEIAKLLPGVSVATILEVLTQSFNDSISDKEKKDRESGEPAIVVGDASCKPA